MYFTFQSGSIQIILSNVICKKRTVLYIPIWFYSNYVLELQTTRPPFLYIPIWFYSNYTPPAVYEAVRDLYIPICFYSNPGWKSIILISSYFTFQSGSIQIIFTASFKSPITNFTFQSGSIQIHQTSVRLYTS